jgi:peptidoglycan/LPS O-acetylase OafA/YrhL
MVLAMQANSAVLAQATHHEQRLVALDGLRGLMTILVVVSHYFAEVPHGITALMVGWIAVDMFFVLSGFLVGRLILDKQENDNFFTVFYARRVFRTLPIYFVCLIVNVVLLSVFTGHWVDADGAFPIWSYFVFAQNFFMAATDGIGAHWLAPTWTLAIEEHFYLLVPALFFIVPRNRIAAVLAALALGAVAARMGTVALLGDKAAIAASVLLPNRADVLVMGLLAAVAIRSKLPWPRLDLSMRVAPILLLAAIAAMTQFGGRHAFIVFAPLLTAVACAAFLLSLVRGAPEAKRFTGKFLGFFNTTSYAVYLTHLPVLGVMHGLLLGTRPDIATPQQWAVTFAALPVTVLVAWVLTVLVERPLTGYGRSWKWSGRPRASAAAEEPAVPALAPATVQATAPALRAAA